MDTARRVQRTLCVCVTIVELNWKIALANCIGRLASRFSKSHWRIRVTALTALAFVGWTRRLQEPAALWTAADLRALG